MTVTIKNEFKDQLTDLFKASFEKKANAVTIIDLSEKNLLMDYFIVMDADNDIQVKAIADNIVKTMQEKHNLKPTSIEGYDNGQWILLDYIDFVAHVFLDEVRRYYDLEEIWNNCPQELLDENEEGGE